MSFSSSTSISMGRGELGGPDEGGGFVHGDDAAGEEADKPWSVRVARVMVKRTGGGFSRRVHKLRFNDLRWRRGRRLRLQLLTALSRSVGLCIRIRFSLLLEVIKQCALLRGLEPISQCCSRLCVLALTEFLSDPFEVNFFLGGMGQTSDTSREDEDERARQTAFASDASE